MDRRTLRDSPAPRRRHHGRSVDRGRPRRARHVGRRSRRDRRAGARNDHARHSMGQRRRRPERARSSLRCLRRQRGVLGLRVRARHRPRDDRHGCPQGAAHRHRLAVADRRLGRPQHGDPVRRRFRRSRARSGRGARAVALLGSRRRRLARPSAVGRCRRVHPDGGQRGLPTCRPDHGRLGHQVAEPRRAHRRRHLARRASPGQHPHHPGCVQAASGSTATVR